MYVYVSRVYTIHACLSVCLCFETGLNDAMEQASKVKKSIRKFLTSLEAGRQKGRRETKVELVSTTYRQ